MPQHRDRLTPAAPDPHDELAAIVALAEALVPEIAARLALLCAGTSNVGACRLFIDVEIRGLLSALAAGRSETARRALGRELVPAAGTKGRP